LKRPFHLYPDEDGDPAGEIDDRAFYLDVQPTSTHAYSLDNGLLYALLDKGITTIVMLEPTRRFTSDIEDWSTLGHDHGEYTTLNTSHMAER